MTNLFNICSSSSGNAALLHHRGTNILVDAGAGVRALTKCLAQVGVAPNRINGIVITHEHVDHIKGLEALLRSCQIPVYATVGTLKALCCKHQIPAGADLVAIDTSAFVIGDIGVKAFRTSHDSAESVGYTFTDSSGKRVAVCTDLGYVTDEVADNVLGCDFVLLESNYDENMLFCGSYPYHLKLRIAGDKGHLSNNDSAIFAAKLIQSGTKQIALAHLSKQNNTPELAYETMVCSLAQNGIQKSVDYRLHIAARTCNEDVWQI